MRSALPGVFANRSPIVGSLRCTWGGDETDSSRFGIRESCTGVDGVITPADVAAAVVQGIAEEQFLILPHPEVATYRERKTADYDRWLNGMRKLRRRFGNPDV